MNFATPTRAISLSCITLALAGAGMLPDDPAPSSSLLAQTGVSVHAGEDEDRHALRAASMFAVAPAEERVMQRHDLVQIIVREESETRSRHEMETTKEYGIDGAIPRFPRFTLSDLLDMQLQAGRTTNTPELEMEFNKEFSGDGDYRRRDDMSARITAEVIDVLPNGNLVLEARTYIKTDREESTMKVTGICRQDDITAVNTVLSNQIHDLTIEKVHHGDLKDANEKGIIARVLDTVFAF